MRRWWWWWRWDYDDVTHSAYSGLEVIFRNTLAEENDGWDDGGMKLSNEKEMV